MLFEEHNKLQAAMDLLTGNEHTCDFDDGCLCSTAASNDSTCATFEPMNFTFAQFCHANSGNLVPIPIVPDEQGRQALLSADKAALSVVLNEMVSAADSSMAEWQHSETTKSNMSQSSYIALLNKYSNICDDHLNWNLANQSATNTQIAFLVSLVGCTTPEDPQTNLAQFELLNQVTWCNSLMSNYSHVLKLKAFIEDHPWKIDLNHDQQPISDQLDSATDLGESAAEQHIASQGLTAAMQPITLECLPELDVTGQKVTGFFLRQESTSSILLNFMVGSKFCIMDSRYSVRDDKKFAEVTIDEAYHWDILTDFQSAHEMVRAFQISLKWLAPRLHLLTAGIHTDSCTQLGPSDSPVATLVCGAADFYQNTLQQLLDKLSLISCDDQTIFNQVKQMWEQKGIDYEKYEHTRLIEILNLNTSISHFLLLKRISRLLSKISSDPDVSAKYGGLAQNNRRTCTYLKDRAKRLIRSFNPHLLSNWRMLGFAVHASDLKSRVTIECRLPTNIANYSLRTTNTTYFTHQSPDRGLQSCQDIISPVLSR